VTPFLSFFSLVPLQPSRNSKRDRRFYALLPVSILPPPLRRRLGQKARSASPSSAVLCSHALLPSTTETRTFLEYFSSSIPLGKSHLRAHEVGCRSRDRPRLPRLSLCPYVAGSRVRPPSLVLLFPGRGAGRPPPGPVSWLAREIPAPTFPLLPPSFSTGQRPREGALYLPPRFPVSLTLFIFVKEPFHFRLLALFSSAKRVDTAALRRLSSFSASPY